MSLRISGSASGLLLPSNAIEGVPLTGYGHSYLALSTAWAQRRYFERIGSRIRSGTVTNRGVSGYSAQDVASYAHGTFTAAAGGGSTVAGTWTPTTVPGGLVIIDPFRNDAGWDGFSSTTKARAGATNALDSILALVRSQSALQDTNGAFVYTGTWTSQANAQMSGGNGHHTNTNGDKVTITTPSGTDFDLMSLGFDTVLDGSPFTVTVDGVDITSTLSGAGYPVTAHLQCNQSKVAACNWTQMRIPLRGLSAGTHTVVVTHTGTSSQFLYVTRLLTPSVNPPTTIIFKIAQVGSTGYASYTSASASWATDQIYNAIIDTVAARFGALTTIASGVQATADRSIITVDPNAFGWSTSYLSSQDTNLLHPGDRGMAFYADMTMSVLGTLGYRLGQNTI